MTPGPVRGEAPDPGTVRLFVCVDPSPAAVDHLLAVVRGLDVSRPDGPGRATRITSPDRWHVTLAFIGDVAADRIPDVTRALDAAARDAAGDAAAPHAAAAAEGRAGPGAVGAITVRFAGGGTFGHGPRTILWAGLDGDVPGLHRLAAAVRSRLRRAGLPYDRRDLRPHLTISRPGARVEPAAIEADVRTLAPYQGPQWTITGLHLMRSQVGPEPVYTRLHHVDLTGARPRER